MKIEFDSVTKSFGKKVVLKDLSFKCGRGEIIGFVGPNGAGKTTTMRLILGLLFADEGRILYDGIPQELAIPEVRKNFGYLPENNPLPEEMVVADYLEFQAKSRGVKDESQRIRKLASELDFSEYLLQPIGNLSKGYRQRVGIAAALLSDPEVLILDEPQEGLDPAQRLEIRQLIKDLGKNRTVILSTHILSEVVETCNRIILINRGRIVLDASLDEALKRFATKSFRVSARGRRVAELFSEKFGRENVRTIEKSGDLATIEVLSEADIREDIFRFCVENDLVLLELKKEEATLEEIFLQLTEKGKQ